MTMDRTLKASSSLLRTRSVLTRAERIEKLEEDGKFELGKDSPLGLPKVLVKKTKLGKGKKEEKAEDAVEATSPE